ncbi:MAG: radical SAM protein [Ferruginibacter sp.]
MDTLISARPVIKTNRHTVIHERIDQRKIISGITVSGVHQKIIKVFIWINILRIALRLFKSPRIAFKKAKDLRRLRDQYRNDHSLKKYKKVNGLYFFNYNAPGWPSKTFDRYVKHLFSKVSPEPTSSLHTLIFAITKKCGFKCEHCCEWENLNQPEQLSKEDLLLITRRFYDIGVSQVQLSGGEPLNRFDDIIYLLDNSPAEINFWLYTTGYQLTRQKAMQLKEHGMTGITISLDDHDPEKHDLFRGKARSFERALLAARYAVESGLAVTFSLCATKNFISNENLMRYAELAKNAGASFIQLLEPKAVGHYAGKDVTLETSHLKILEAFYEKMNYDKAYSSYPLVAYHGFYSRRIGCSGSGKDYLYVDTDGDVHNCPFCQRKLFPALDDALPKRIMQMKTQGCGLYNSCSTKI